MNNPFDFFNKVFCINLKEREDRWKESVVNFSKYGIKNYERIGAVRIKDDTLNSKRRGQIGCSLSYACTINKALKENAEKILILEDDFDFIFGKEKLYKKINSAIDDLPEDWDCLYFGGTTVEEYGHKPLEKYSTNLLKLKCAYTTHSIAFSRTGMLKILALLKHSEEKPWHETIIKNYVCIDSFLAKDYQKNTNSFITSDVLCVQRPSFSDIENTNYDYKSWMINNFAKFKKEL